MHECVNGLVLIDLVLVVIVGSKSSFDHSHKLCEAVNTFHLNSI